MAGSLWVRCPETTQKSTKCKIQAQMILKKEAAQQLATKDNSTPN